jgi:hypothetical protein
MQNAPTALAKPAAAMVQQMTFDLAHAVEQLHDLVLTSDYGIQNDAALSNIQTIAAEIRSSTDLTPRGRQIVASLLRWASLVYSDDLHQKGEAKLKGGADYVRFELLLDIERLKNTVGTK